MIKAILMLVTVGTLFLPAEVASAGGCGLKPLKPLPPIGCKDLVAVCMCGTDGKTCQWEWQCVPR